RMDSLVSLTATDTCRRFIGISCVGICGFAHRTAANSSSPTNLRAALATIFGEVGQQCVHAAIVRGIEDGPALASRRYQPGATQLRQMKRHRGSGNVEPLGDCPGRKALGPLANEQSENRKPRLLRKCGQSIYCLS